MALPNSEKIAKIQELLDRTLEDISSTTKQWGEFLAVAGAGFYKYKFADQVLIFAQRPDASACASFEFWNRLERYVKRGSTGIALLDESEERQKLRYVFDVSDTGGTKPFPKLWSYKEEFVEVVSKAIGDIYSEYSKADESDSLQRLIDNAALSLSYDYLNEAGIDSNVLLSLSARSAASVVRTRMRLEEGRQPDIRGIEAIEYDDVILLGNAVNYAAGEILRAVEQAILNEIRERRKNHVKNNKNGKGNSVRETGRLLDPGTGSVGAEGRWTLWPDEAEIHTGKAQSLVRQSDIQMRTEFISEEGQRGSGRDVKTSGERTAREKSRPEQDERQSGLGSPHEHDTGTGNRTDGGGTNLLLEADREFALSSRSAPAEDKVKGESAGQLSLFPMEEARTDAVDPVYVPVDGVKTREGKKLSPQNISDVRHVLLKDEQLLSQKYLVYKNLTREPDAKAVADWLRDIHKNAVGTRLSLGDSTRTAFVTYEAKGINIDAGIQDGRNVEIKISWMQARTILLDLIREKKFITEEELSVRAGHPSSALPPISQADLDRIIMPPASSNYCKNIVFEIVSQDKGGEQTYDSLFKSNSYKQHSKMAYHFRDGTVGRVEADEDGVYIEKPGYAPSYLTWRQVYGRIAELIADGTYYEWYYSENRLLTREAVGALLCMVPATEWGKEYIFKIFTSTEDDAEKISALQISYPIGKEEILLTPDNTGESGRIYYDEDGIRIHVYDEKTVGEHGYRNTECVYLHWKEIKEQIEKLIADDKYNVSVEPSFVNNNGALIVRENDVREFLRHGTGFPGAKNRIAAAYASGGRDAMEETILAEYSGARFSVYPEHKDKGGIHHYVYIDANGSMCYAKTQTGGMFAPSAKRIAVIDAEKVKDFFEDVIKQGIYLTSDDVNLSQEIINAGREISENDIAEVCLHSNINERQRIENVFLRASSMSERQKFLRELNGQSGYSYTFSSGLCGFVDYSTKGMRISKADISRDFTYADVAKVISRHIENKSYITEQEREEIRGRYTESRNEDVRTEESQEKNSGAGATAAASWAEHVPIDYCIADDDIGAGKPKERYAHNAAAIRLLKSLEAKGRYASEEEQEILARYVGWGGLARAFDEKDSSWSKEYSELKNLLTEEEYRSARASTLTSYYTPPTVAKAIHSTLKRMGYEGGNVLEPAMGIGHFFGTMPYEVRCKSRLYGVELDSLSGRIARQLYQTAAIKVCGYESTDYQDNFFDLVIGNVPFGQYKVADTRYSKLNYNIHDYFIAKSLDKVRPGGVIAFVTSRYTLDKENPSVRRYIAQRAELLGAVRLLDTTFKNAAGTDVVSDILILQKRERLIDVEPEWMFTGKTDDGIPINEYYVKHPEMVCGNIELTSSAYGPIPTCRLQENASLSERLEAALSNVEGHITEAAVVLYDEEDRPSKTIPATPDVRNFSYTVIDGEVYYRENALMYKPEKVIGTRADRIKGLVALRDCTRELIDYQLNGYSDENISAKQLELRQMYDSYTRKYGIINSRGNAQAFEADSGYFLLCSLEVLDAEGNLKGLADMFTKRTIGFKAVPDKVDTAVEALAVSISERACVDIPYMSSLTGKTDEEIISDLQGVIFKNPAKSMQGEATYESSDEYLSGDVVHKLEVARMAAETNPGEYAANVAALEKVQPEKLTASDIDVRLGSSWVDAVFVKDFIVELLEPRRYFIDQELRVAYSPYTAEWRIDGKNRDSWNVKATQAYGTERANAYRLIEDALNGRTTTVYDTVTMPDGKETREVNKQETAIAQQKQQNIKDKFKDWIFSDLKRREELVEKYNRLFNTTRPREYDGSHILFSGMNPEIRLTKHQKDAIARILYGPNTLLAHVVGAGKTFEMVASAMESKRLGLCRKSMIVVPNHLTEQTAAEFMKLYPAANILVTTRRDFETKNRKTFCARIATGEYDAVIIGFSQFEKIPVSEERQEKYIEKQIDDLVFGIGDLAADNAPRYSIKRLENMKKNLETKLENLHARMSARKDDVITFEELGIDRLYIDEAHNFKNLMVYTKMQNVAGISTSDAQKSNDLYLKCRYIDEITGGTGIIFATGTPVSNSMVELYTLQRYLQINELEKRGLAHFDSWASVFGETATSIELAPEGNGYRARTRFSKFFNLPELMSMFREVADIKTSDMLSLPVPNAHFENIAVPASSEQLEMIGKLSERAEKIRNKLVEPWEDNMLKVTSDGRKIGLDQRLMDNALPDDPGSKVNACVGNVLRIWNETKEQKSTQLIFCDFSTPSKEFNLYDDIKTKLIKAGVPENEIAYIHDANTEVKKAALFSKVRAGSVRVLLGSTQKMGAGTNVQERLIASHDLDCPWRPADLEQRAGRIIRQGNRNKDVYVYRYVTERTFDSYLYQTIENKQKFIAQIMTSKNPLRSCGDVDESVLQYAEVKALCAGDPRIKEKMDLDVQVGRLKMLKAAYQNNRYDLEHQVAVSIPRKLAECRSIIEKLKGDKEHLAQNTCEDNEEKFSPMTSSLFDKVCTTRKSAGETILMAKELAKPDESIHIGFYRGFEMYLTYRTFGGEYVLTLYREGGLQHHVTLGGDAGGNITRVNNTLGDIPKALELKEAEFNELNRRLEGYSLELRRPFEYENELHEKSQRLNELDSILNLGGTTNNEQKDIEIPKPAAGAEVQDDNSFLSNDYPCRIEMDGTVFGSASQAYLYFMCREQSDKERVLAAASPADAQAAVVGAPVCDGWYFSGSLDAMREVVEAKFVQNPELAGKLAEVDENAITYKNGGKGVFWALMQKQEKEKTTLGKYLCRLRRTY